MFFSRVERMPSYDAHQSELTAAAYAHSLGVLRRFLGLEVAFKKGK
tara:strand:+ start:561 stop:698 length:138 start_codon:yes stop_codon:yes gene_type:complete